MKNKTSVNTNIHKNDNDEVDQHYLPTNKGEVMNRYAPLLSRVTRSGKNLDEIMYSFSPLFRSSRWVKCYQNVLSLRTLTVGCDWWPEISGPVLDISFSNHENRLRLEQVFLPPDTAPLLADLLEHKFATMLDHPSVGPLDPKEMELQEKFPNEELGDLFVDTKLDGNRRMLQIWMEEFGSIRCHPLEFQSVIEGLRTALAFLDETANT